MEPREEIILNTIFRRRSIRRYKAQEVERGRIIRLLQAGMAAPSACNLQIWEFVVVTERGRLSELRKATIEGNYDAPVAVVVCGNTANVPWDDEDWRIDCSAAAAVRALLGIPDHIKVMSVVYFGYPAEEKSPGTKYNEEAVYWETYSADRKRNLRTMGQKYD
jgi:nitroreductase